ncbi:MAG TPA: hypothetical protein VHQ20_00715 [Patescibacteria group bacterium]|jgi:predicted DNA-binding protein|nr:hypothetical protein [Patescibacteria group bacterium]
MAISDIHDFLDKLPTHAIDLGDAFLMKEAIDTLYHRIEDWALQVDALREDNVDTQGEELAENTMQMARLLFKIQQVTNTEPLDHFLLALSKDEYYAIRIAAKGNLEERIGGFMDFETAAIANTNFLVMGYAVDLITEVYSDEEILKGLHDWKNAKVSEHLPYDYKDTTA